MGTTFRLAWRNIWRHPRRTILTMIAIGFGCALLVFSIGLQLGQYDLMIANSVKIFEGLVQVQKDGYLEDSRIRTSIPNVQKLSQKIRSETGLTDVSPRANGFALVSSETRTYGTMIIGVDPKYEDKVSIIPGLVKEGRFLSSINAQELVLGKSLAKNMKISLGDEVTIMGNGRDGSIAATILPVVGIFESGTKELDRSIIEIPLGTFQDVFSMGNHGHSIVLYHRDANRVNAIQQQSQAIINSEENLVALRWDQLQPGLKEAIELDYSSGWFMYIVLVAIIVFSIMNTFLMSVMERTREFGILLALGYKAFNIGKLVMLEATLLTIVAVMAGTAIGVGVNYYFYVYGLTLTGMEEIASMYNMPSTITPQISFNSVFIGPAIIFISTIISALYPAMRIRLLEPVEAMRKI